MNQVVRVYIGNPTLQGKFNGTAFFVDSHTLITAKHVVERRRDNLVYITDIPDGGVLSINEVILCDRDIAILKVKKSFNINTLPFTEQINQGSNVNIIGFYDNFSSRKSYENRVIGYYNKEHTYELQNHLTNGLSGSPVLVDGNVCGVAVAIQRDKNITYIIPISEACVELDIVHLSSKKSIELKKEEIEKIIISNDLTKAIKLIVELTTNSSNQIRREAILHQSNLNAMNEELRKFGESEKSDRQFKQLKNALFEFLDVMGEK